MGLLFRSKFPSRCRTYFPFFELCMYTGVRGLLRTVCSWNLEQFTAVRVHCLPIAPIEPSTHQILWRSIISSGSGFYIKCSHCLCRDKGAIDKSAIDKAVIRLTWSALNVLSQLTTASLTSLYWLLFRSIYLSIRMVYPPVQPYDVGKLKISDIHTLQ